MGTFSDPEQVQQQRARDLIKLALAQQHNIRLVTIHAKDLTFDRLAEKVDGLLTVQELRQENSVVRFLGAPVVFTPDGPDARGILPEQCCTAKVDSPAVAL